MREALAEGIAKRLQNAVITMKVGANEKGHLYQKLSPEAIMQAVLLQTKEAVAASAFNLPKAIQEVGDYQIEMKLEKSRASFTVKVEKN